MDEGDDARPDLIVNGRFLTRPMTGVDRYATEMVRALAALRARSGKAHRIDVAIPRSDLSDETIRAALDLAVEDRIFRSRFSAYLWEQCILPFVARDSLLLSFCNLGPIARKRQVVVIHDSQVFDAPGSYSRPFRLAYAALQPLIARRVAVLATVSEFSRGRLHANGIGTGREITVVPNGSDHLSDLESEDRIFRKLGIEQGRYFFAIGANAPHKRIAMLADACSQSPDPRFPLVIAGSIGADLAASFERVANRPVHLVGRVSDRELKALYTGAAAFLFPSLTEGFGLPVVEAMACGCPVIASTGGALPEVCGGAAILCDPNDPNAWAAAMSSLETDASLAERYSVLGKARSRQFRWEASAGILLDAIRAARPQLA